MRFHCIGSWFRYCIRYFLSKWLRTLRGFKFSINWINICEFSRACNSVILDHGFVILSGISSVNGCAVFLLLIR